MGQYSVCYSNYLIYSLFPSEFTGDLTLALEPVVPEGDQDLDLTTDSAAGITLQPEAFPHGVDDNTVDQEGDSSSKPLSRTGKTRVYYWCKGS